MPIKGRKIKANQFWNTIKTMLLFTINHDAIIKIRKICTLRSPKHLSLFCYCIHQTDRWVYVIGYVQQEKSAQRSTDNVNYALLIHTVNYIFAHTSIRIKRYYTVFINEKCKEYLQNYYHKKAHHVLILNARLAEIYNYSETSRLS